MTSASTANPLLEPSAPADATPTALAPIALAITAALGPLWGTWFGVQQLAVGRLCLVALAVCIALDLRRRPLSTLRPWLGVARLGGGLILLLLWTGLSAATWGCFCSGSTQGFADLVAFTVLASVIALYITPKQALVALAAAMAGVLVAGLLSVVGLRDLHANAYVEGSSVARLEGVYGNSNFLGFALALGVPVAVLGVLRLSGTQRLLAVGATVALIVPLYMTFSRGSLIAASFGVSAVLWVDLTLRYGRGRVFDVRTAAIAAILPLLTMALVTTPFYKDQRVRADFGAQVDAPATGGQTPGGQPAGHSGTRKEELHAVEGEYVESRTEGLRLAAQAFSEQPVRGIGMDSFPAYSDEHADFGELPTHNTYAQVLAELGGVGILLFAFTGISVLVSLVRGRSPVPLRAAIAGVLAVGVVNFVFINGLASTGMVMPLALAMAFAAGWDGIRGRDEDPALAG